MLKASSFFVLSTFLIVGAFGLLTLSNHHHEPGCPFMPGEQAMCEMNISDHISAWQNTFVSLLPFFLNLVVLAFLSVSIAKKFYTPSQFSLYVFKKKLRLYIFNLYQELFSSGLLNPKAP